MGPDDDNHEVDSALPSEYRQDEALRTLANFLRSENGVKQYNAVEHEKRVNYFKGKHFVEVLLSMGHEMDPKKSKKWPKSIPRITEEHVAVAVGDALLNKNFFHRSNKESRGAVKTGDVILTASSIHKFENTGYYTWMYQGEMTLRYLMSG